MARCECVLSIKGATKCWYCRELDFLIAEYQKGNISLEEYAAAKNRLEDQKS